MKTTLLTPRGYRRRSKSRIFAQKGQRARFPLPHDACVGAKKPLEVLESRDEISVTANLQAHPRCWLPKSSRF